jgi:hypothetical protein
MPYKERKFEAKKSIELIKWQKQAVLLSPPHQSLRDSFPSGGKPLKQRRTK